MAEQIQRRSLLSEMSPRGPSGKGDEKRKSSTNAFPTHGLSSGSTHVLTPLDREEITRGRSLDDVMDATDASAAIVRLLESSRCVTMRGLASIIMMNQSRW